jgi:hypothetical protein
MKVIEWIDKMKAEGIANFFIVYANIGNDSDELIACEPCEASDCEVVDTIFITNNVGITAVITAVA